MKRRDWIICLSLVAIVHLADPTLWFGALCDAPLLLLGLWRAYGGWPAHPGVRRSPAQSDKDAFGFLAAPEGRAR